MLRTLMLAGARSGWQPRLIAVGWLSNLAVAALLLPQLLQLMSETLGPVGYRDEMESGLSQRWWVDVISHFQALLTQTSLQLIGLVALAVVVHVLLAGGVTSCLARSQGLARPYWIDWHATGFWKTFGTDCGRLFGRFLRLFLVGTVLYGCAAGFAYFCWLVVSGILDSRSDLLQQLARGVRDAVLALVVAFIAVALDCARLEMTARDSPAAVLNLGRSLRYLVRYWRAILLLSAVVWILSNGLLWLLSARLEGWSLRAPLWQVIPYFQMVILARVAARFWFLASQLELMRRLNVLPGDQQPWFQPFWSSARPRSPWNF